MSRHFSFLDIGATEGTVFLKFYEPTTRFTLKVHFDVRDSFVLTSHEHRDCTAIRQQVSNSSTAKRAPAVSVRRDANFSLPLQAATC